MLPIQLLTDRLVDLHELFVRHLVRRLKKEWPFMKKRSMLFRKYISYAWNKKNKYINIILHTNISRNLLEIKFMTYY